MIIAVSERGLAIGFMGIENGKLEMLFISPEERGKGIGKRFIQHSVETLSVSEVTVNEQNPEAIGFYEHMGLKRAAAVKRWIKKPIKKEIEFYIYTS